jgi:4'-phosphopantetheinyl transferase
MVLFRYNEPVTSDKLSGTLLTPTALVHWLRLRNDNESATLAEETAFLNAVELGYWTALKSDKRRQDWLLGRRAAKELVAVVFKKQTGRDIPYQQITILPHDDGWPIVTVASEYELPALTLSVSHSRRTAFCAAVEGENWPLGADIEAVEPRSVAFAEEYFTQLEQQFLSVAPPNQQTTLVNAIWSGKEAALKAIRRGLAEDTRLVCCFPHPAMAGGSDWMPMRIKWKEERSITPKPSLAGYWRREGDFVMTLAFAAPGI